MITQEEWIYALILLSKFGYEIIQKYPNQEQLETGYRGWKKFADDKKIPRPFPVEFLESEYRVLEDILYKDDPILN